LRFESHREAANDRLVCEDALLRQQQDEEYAEALAFDQSASTVIADSASMNCTGYPEVDASVADTAESKESPKDAVDHEQEHLLKRRRLLADVFMSSAPDLPSGSATARLVLRLPSGERVERAFASSESFSRVREWVECCAHLPEARDRDLQIPIHFDLAIAMPPQKFSSEEDDKSLVDLGLAPSAALLVIERIAS
jgi:hypothetical protein